MGLDVSHGAFHGAYSAFNRFRQAVAQAMGGSFPPHSNPDMETESWYWGDGYSVGTHPGLAEFMRHSDCDGDISPTMCAKVADDLEALLPAIDGMGSGGGHIERNGGYGEVARRFIAGCREAAAAGETLEFY
jgi:hypothetical protein